MEDAEVDGGDAPSATFELPEASRRVMAEQEKLIQELELKQKVKTTVVPTDPAAVKAMLRAIGEPVTLFGEREPERRERLQKIVATREGLELPEAAPVGQLVVEQELALQTETFYTEGSEALKTSRLQLAEWSLARAAKRLAAARALTADGDAQGAKRATDAAALRRIATVAQQSSEIGDDRPISGCAFSPDGGALATCGWGGMVSVWQAAGGRRLQQFRAHEERCTGIAWHPDASTSAPAGGMEVEGASEAPSTLALATGGADGTGRLWSAAGRLLHTLRGHTDRLGRVAFHPMGRHLATASFDSTWRLWDMEAAACLLEQEGHSRAVYAVAFHPDGSLAASVGLDAHVRLWDLRTGRCALTLQGHVKQVLAVDFSPDGTHLATGSDDNACRIWDLRAKRCEYVLPAHRSLISAVRYEPAHGRYLCTASYDQTVKLWSARDHRLVKTLAGHEGKVMCADVSPDGSHSIASVAYDRTLKTWAPDDTVELLPSDEESAGEGDSGSEGGDVMME